MEKKPYNKNRGGYRGGNDRFERREPVEESSKSITP